MTWSSWQCWPPLMDRDYEYPAGELGKAWQLVCLNQFHDIIPGSSIAQVYVESLEHYRQIGKIGAAARDGALESIAGKVAGDLLVINPTSFDRNDLAFWSGRLAPRSCCRLPMVPRCLPRSPTTAPG